MYRLFFILLLASATMFLGCSENKQISANTTNTAATANVSNIPPVTAVWKKDVTTDDLARLKWLEGKWRGTGEGQEPFYEKYSFDSSSLIVESFSNETFKTVTDTTRYALINGEFRHTTTDGRRVAASEITDKLIQFVPVVGEGNSFRFERQDEGKWRAVLEWPATADKPAKQVIYNMEPVKK